MRIYPHSAEPSLSHARGGFTSWRLLSIKKSSWFLRSSHSSNCMCVYVSRKCRRKKWNKSKPNDTLKFPFPTQLKTTPFTVSLLSFSVRSCREKKKIQNLFCFLRLSIDGSARARDVAGVAVNWWRSHLMFIIFCFVLVSIASIEPPLESPHGISRDV